MLFRSQYAATAKIEKDKDKLAKIYHNMGVIFQAGKDYGQAVEAYKMSLRNDPSDHETRYNLALAQKLLKDQQQQNQDQNQDQNQENQDQQQDKDQNQDQNKDEQNKDEQQQPSQPEQNENEMSKENAEQLLKSVMQDEKDTQDKVQKKQAVKGGRLEKDW